MFPGVLAGGAGVEDLAGAGSYDLMSLRVGSHFLREKSVTSSRKNRGFNLRRALAAEPVSLARPDDCISRKANESNKTRRIKVS